MSLTATVGELVVQRPSRARVFERFGIDYCCGGKFPLADVCRKKGIDPAQVLAALDQDDAGSPASDRDWSAASVTELTAHIEATHHAYLRREMPRLEYLTGRVADRHGDQRPELRRVQQIFLAFKTEMDAHMGKEEQILFPMCRELEHATSVPAFHCGSVCNPVAMMISEHDNAGEALRQMRELTGDYVPPAEACNTYRAMLAGLAELEADTHRHVHLENNILFPKAIAAESCLTGCGV
jgi:regulator of cell morphogenesis and NO signaling